MLKKENSTSVTNLGSLTMRNDSTNDSNSLMQKYEGEYKTVSIDTPIAVFNDNTLGNKELNVDYGVLELLKGTWFSYNENSSIRKSSGIHTTIMPSPGTNQNKIPGKFSFECEEYLEKLHFELVPDPVRNRGGASEQFCGALKYEQSIKSVSKSPKPNGMFPGIHEENGMYLWMSDIMNHEASIKSIEDDRGVHNWNNEEAIKKLINNLYPEFPSEQEVKSLKAIVEKHPYLDVTLYNIGSIEKPTYVTKENINNRPYVSIVPAKELALGEGVDGGHFIPDYSISRSGVIPHGSTITLLGNVTRDSQNHIVQKGKPNFIKLSPLAKQIIQILGKNNITTYNQAIELVSQYVEDNVDIEDSKVLALTSFLGYPKKPSYRDLFYEIKTILEKEKISSQWDYEHLAIDKTMGGGKNSSNNDKIGIPKDLKRPFDLDNPPSEFTKLDDLNSYNDDGENIVYTQRMFTDPLYPYSIRPDFRLRDSIKNQKIEKYIHFNLSSKKPSGQQGGILNIPFVNKFVPTVEMNMNMWIEEVEDNGKRILQLQYEQIVFFEFGFGDTGGTTRWPHIQVNTLRKYEDLPKEQQKVIQEQFYKEITENNNVSKCPFHK